MDENSKSPMQVTEEEKKILLDHDYDGIQELDHPLPLWWMGTFIATIVFSIPYWFYYHHLGGPSLVKTFEQDMQAVTAKREAFEATQNRFKPDHYAAFVMTEEAKQMGAKTYKRRCKACHGEVGEGGIGPNLADNYWLHGDGSAGAVFKVVEKGVPDKGMQAWGDSLDDQQLMSVVAYVLSFKGTNPAGAKAPQGTQIQ